MNDERAGEGGAANTPPFPPIPRTDTEAAPEAERTDAPEPADWSTLEQDPGLPTEPVETMRDVPASSDPRESAYGSIQKDQAWTGRDRDKHDGVSGAPTEWDGITDQNTSDRASIGDPRREGQAAAFSPVEPTEPFRTGDEAADPYGATEDPTQTDHSGEDQKEANRSAGYEGGRRRRYTHGPAAEARRRAADGVTRTFARLADRLEEAAERIDELASDERFTTGPAERIGATAAATSDRIEDLADYLRASDLETLRNDLERRVRERPLQSVFLALGAGWVFGRVMR